MSQLFAELFRYVSVHACHAVTLCLMTDCRYSRRTCRLVWTAVGTVNILLTLLLYALPPAGIANGPFVAASFLSAVSYGMTYVCLAKGPWQRTLFLFSSYITVFLYALGVAACLSKLFFNGSDLAVTGLRTLFFAAYILLLRWFIRPAFLRATEEITGGWGTMATLGVFTCAVTFLAGACMILLDMYPPYWLLLIALMLALVAAEYAAILRMMGLLSRQQAARAAEAQRKLLESQLAAEREFVAQTRAYRHDMRHHAALLADYLGREDASGAKEYLSQYMTVLEAGTLESYCENPVADALLRLTARRCRESGVPFTIRTVIPEALSLSGPELAAVLGNVLENAWEAAGACQAPRLSVTAQVKGGSLLVEVENTVDHPSRFEDDLPLTTKPGGGQGLKTVRRTLEKHGGMLRCSRQDSVFDTQMTIPL